MDNSYKELQKKYNRLQMQYDILNSCFDSLREDLAKTQSDQLKLMAASFFTGLNLAVTFVASYYLYNG